MKTPKISIIIPIYNDKLYLTDAVQSIRQQIFTDWECICVNDGSTDKSEEIIDNFVKCDSRFSKINQENGGVSSARNTGLKIARGEYVYFMDHDDLIPNYTLEYLFEAAEKFNADIARGRKMMIAEDFKLEQLKNETHLQKIRNFSNPVNYFDKHTGGKYRLWCHIWMCLFKRSVIQQIEFVEELRAGGEDNLFMYEVISKIKKIVQIDNIILCHRYSKTSVTLNGYNPTLIKMFEVRIPYIYKHYATAEGTSKQFLQWVYRKESYSAYKHLIVKTIRANQNSIFALSTEVLTKFDNTPEFNNIIKYWSFRQKFFYSLFISKNFRLLRLLRIFL